MKFYVQNDLFQLLRADSFSQNLFISRQLVKNPAVTGLFYGIVFSRTCTGKKHTNPPVFPQKNGETGPQAGAFLSRKTQRSGFSTVWRPPRGRAAFCGVDFVPLHSAKIYPNKRGPHEIADFAAAISAADGPHGAAPLFAASILCRLRRPKSIQIKGDPTKSQISWGESACKPGSVYAAIYLGCASPHTSSHLSGDWPSKP